MVVTIYVLGLALARPGASRKKNIYMLESRSPTPRPAARQTRMAFMARRGVEEPWTDCAGGGG